MTHQPQTFGAFIKERRIALAKTLRQFCEEHQLDPGNMSKVERDRLPPPQQEGWLQRYAEALGIRPGSDDWAEFHRLAAIAAGRIPHEILSDDELMAKLPVVFRTIGNRKPTDEDLESLIKLLREA